MTRNGLLGYLITFIFICSAPTVQAYDQPAVNLGYTSFLDGSPPAGPGFYFQDYLQYYSPNRLNDDKGHRLELPRTKLDIIANITQLIYLSEQKIFGANLGISALIPWLVKSKINDGLGNSVLKAQTGAGDLFIGPALQFQPVMHKGRPVFVQRLELDIVAPIGRYNRNYAINPSSNYWSLNPYWAATIWFTSKWTTAFRLHYLWNARNHQPNISFGPHINNTQAGQAVFANLATEYGFTERFHAGLNGYFFNQFTDTKANGLKIRGRREKVWAIGPGLLLGLTKNQFLFANLYFEQDARNRPQGTNAILRYVLHF